MDKIVSASSRRCFGLDAHLSAPNKSHFLMMASTNGSLPPPAPAILPLPSVTQTKGTGVAAKTSELES